MLQAVEWFLDMLKPRRYKVVSGGRGGAKSRTFAQALITLGSQKPLLVLCAREIQKSLADSSKKLLEEEIKRMGLSRFYKSTLTSIIGKNGTRFVFAGLRHGADSIRSFEGADICWVEEAQSVSDRSLQELIPSIRKEGSEIWFSFNDVAGAAVGERFPLNTDDPDVFRLKVNYDQNPFLPDVLLKEALACEKLFPERYQNVWLGNAGVAEYAIINTSHFARYADIKEVEARCSYKFLTADTAFDIKKFRTNQQFNSGEWKGAATLSRWSRSSAVINAA